MSKKLLLLICFVGIVFGFQRYEEQLFVKPFGWPEPKYNFSNNKLSSAGFEIGRLLFYDPILSGNNTVACSNCHSPYNAFAHVDHALSHGIDDRIGKRNAPALFNLAWQESFMWDGAVNHLDMQPLAPIANHDEMASSIDAVVDKLQQTNLYPPLFYSAFGDSIITGQHVLKAMSQFLLTLVSAESKYDSVMRKEAHFTEQEQNGYKIFQRNCASCHAEPLFTTGKYESNGLALDTALKDYGRMSITHDQRDSLRFKVPSLRNCEYTYPYMHDGRFKRLSEVVKHYTSGIQRSKSLSKPLEKAIQLTGHEQVDLVAFLLTLSDRNFLFDKRHAFPQELLRR